MNLKTARIGDTLHIFDIASEATVKKNNIVPDGHAARRSSGTRAEIGSSMSDADTGKTPAGK